MSRRRPFRVTLACGCKIGLRDFSKRPGARLTCPSGKGHAYNQPWVSFESDAGISGTNPLAPGV